MFLKASIVFLATLVSLFAKATPRPEVNVLSQIEVPANQAIALKFIGNVGFVKPSVEMQILSMPILPALKDQEERKYTNLELVRILKQKISQAAGMHDVSWTYFVPETVTIKASRNHISQIAIKNELTAAYRNLCEECAFTIKDMRMPQMGSERWLSWSMDTSNLMLAGSFLVPMNFNYESGLKQFWVSGVLKIHKEGVKAIRQIGFGQRLEAKDLKVGLVDVSYAKDTPLNMAQAVGQITARPLNANQALFSSDLKKEVAVQRGQIIRAVLGSEVFEISSQAVAEESGFMGDTIKIKNMDSKKQVSGQIIDKGVVRIQ